MNQSITQSNQVVADVDRLARSVLTMQRVSTVTKRVVILNVVMNQRRFMKGFDRHRHFGNTVRNFWCWRSCGQNVATRRSMPCCQRNERTKAFATIRHPVVRNRFCESNWAVCFCSGFGANSWQQAFEVVFEHLRRCAHQRHIAGGRFVRQGFVLVQYVPNPGFVQSGVHAITGMQWHRIRWHTSDQDFVDRFFQDVQTRHAQDAINVSRHNDLQNNGRSFSNQNLVAQLLSANFVIRNRTCAAAFAVESEFGIFGRATFGVFQTMWQQ